VELLDTVGIVFVELSKLGAVMEKPVEEMTAGEMWGIFFGYGNEPKYRGLLNKLILVKEEIKMASELLMGISKDEVERAHYRSRKMFQMDMEHDRAVSRNEGLKEGLIEGRREGLNEGRREGLNEGRSERSQEIARNLLSMGVSADTVANATGLTRAEIEQLSAGN
jgi:predicted transposase/invertase (TIGR01784 family)